MVTRISNPSGQIPAGLPTTPGQLPRTGHSADSLARPAGLSRRSPTPGTMAPRQVAAAAALLQTLQSTGIRNPKIQAQRNDLATQLAALVAQAQSAAARPVHDLLATLQSTGIRNPKLQARWQQFTLNLGNVLGAAGTAAARPAAPRPPLGKLSQGSWAALAKTWLSHMGMGHRTQLQSGLQQSLHALQAGSATLSMAPPTPLRMLLRNAMDLGAAAIQKFQATLASLPPASQPPVAPVGAPPLQAQFGMPMPARPQGSFATPTAPRPQASPATPHQAPPLNAQTGAMMWTPPPPVHTPAPPLTAQTGAMVWAPPPPVHTPAPPLNAHTGAMVWVPPPPVHTPAPPLNTHTGAMVWTPPPPVHAPARPLSAYTGAIVAAPPPPGHTPAPPLTAQTGAIVAVPPPPQSPPSQSIDKPSTVGSRPATAPLSLASMTPVEARKALADRGMTDDKFLAMAKEFREIREGGTDAQNDAFKAKHAGMIDMDGASPKQLALLLQPYMRSLGNGSAARPA